MGYKHLSWSTLYTVGPRRMPLSNKKVIVRRLSGELLSGYLPPNAFVLRDPEGASLLSLLDLEGRSVTIPLSEIKFISYVRDFNREDPDNPERLMRRAFLARPRSEGLWVRITFAAGDQLEGLASGDLALLDNLLADFGLFLTPPDDRINTHRIYIPRSAIAAFQIVAVITTPSRTRQKLSATGQTDLFPSE